MWYTNALELAANVLMFAMSAGLGVWGKEKVQQLLKWLDLKAKSTSNKLDDQVVALLEASLQNTAAVKDVVESSATPPLTSSPEAAKLVSEAAQANAVAEAASSK